ncbi:Hypothetical predicted protein [Paramuricea clavata]|uniref:Uncharacterized protein n=1 Tax=Paramuricea clavata TaxID=317549 RepID=A0A6S7IWQ2_PARCT|nr:Hypothetical predicted protein [Paramuricea clavata]
MNYTRTCRHLTQCGKRKLEASSTQPKEKGKTDSSALLTHLPFPDRLSIKVETAIASGNVLSARKQLIAAVGLGFFYDLVTHPQHGDYKRMAIRTCEKFPELKDANSSTFWVRKDMKKIVPQFAMKKSIDNLRSSFQKIIRKDGKISNADVVDAVQYVEKNYQKKGSSPSKISDAYFKDKDVEFKLVCLSTKEEVRKETKRIMPDFSFKIMERLGDGIKNVSKKNEINNQVVVSAVRLIEKKTVNL